MIHYIDEEGIELEGKRVLLRLDLNVTVENEQIVDDFDLKKIIETVDFLRSKNAQVIIVGHIEDSEGKPTTLTPVWEYLKGFFPVEFSHSYFTPEAIAHLIDLKNGSVLLFENVRNNPGEKENDPDFARKLAAMADLYVNDAFGVSHRKHASIVGVTEFLPHYAGLLMRKEIENLSKVFAPEHPFLFILGGAKFETKLPIIQKYLEKADNVFVGGALANDFFKKLGYELGTSLVSENKSEDDLRKIINNKKLVLPLDVTVSKPDGSVAFKIPDTVSPDEYIGDVGPKTIEMLKELVSSAKTIVWNGPLGNFEKGFADKTEQLAEIIADASSQKSVTSIVGGGDTLASIKKLNLEDKFTFVSTGGGAMLDFLVDETLVGIEALGR